MFLTDEQLQEMTGYVQHAAQIRWLAENGFRFAIRSDGRPNVLIKHVEEKFCDRPSRKRRIEPDLSWMDRNNK